MRLFLAIELPADVRASLAALQGELKQIPTDVKWVAKDQLHLTLRFFGEVDQPRREHIERILADTVPRLTQVAAQLGKPGCFPDSGLPRVLWVGFGQGEAALREIASTLEAALSATGLKSEDRAFVPHVTIGRNRSGRGMRELRAALQQTAWRPPAGFIVEHVTLFESVLSSAGPSYTALGRWPLRT